MDFKASSIKGEVFKFVATGSKEIINENYLNKENNFFEYKEGFNFADLPYYAKIWAGMSNNCGGILWHGVNNNSQIIGLKTNDLESFKNIDRHRISRDFRKYFSHEIQWFQFIYEIEELSLGAIVIKEASIEDKPIIAIREYINSDSTRRLLQGDILFRYDEETTLIKRTELLKIFEQKRRKEFQKIMNKVQLVFEKGAENIAILDLLRGDIDAGFGNIDVKVDVETLNDIVDRIDIVKEGSFVETGGNPALTLKGSIEAIEEILVEVPVDVPYPITLHSFLSDFISGKPTSGVEPLRYIEWLVKSKESGFLPIFFLIKSSEKSFDEVLEYLENLEGIQTDRTLEIVMNRIKHGGNRILAKRKDIDPNRKSSLDRDRLEHINLIFQGEYAFHIEEMISLQNSSVSEEIRRSDHYIRIITDSLLYLTKSQVLQKKEMIFSILGKLIINYGDLTGKSHAQLRLAIQYIDHELFCDLCS